MSIDEIRTQKGLVLLECREAEARVKHAHARLKDLSGALARIAQVLDPDENTRGGSRRMRVPKLATLQSIGAEATLNYPEAVQAVTEMAAALDALSEAQAKRRELGL
jgi:hypothetical protein